MGIGALHGRLSVEFILRCSAELLISPARRSMVGKAVRRRHKGPARARAAVAEPAREPRVRQGPASARDHRTWLVAIPLVLLVAAAFAPALANGFVNWDDDTNFVRNPDYRGLDWAQVKWACTTFLAGVYQPLAWLLLEAQYVLFGLDPRYYHLASLLLHAAAAIALYALTMALLVRCQPDPFLHRPWAGAIGAGLATALFVVHPLRVEPVAWVSCQPYLPCTLFALLAVLAYLRAVGEGPRPRWSWLAAAFALLAAALLCKAPAVAVPAVLLILDVYPLRRLGGGPGRWLGPAARRVWLEKAPFVAISLVFMGLAVAAKADTRAIRPLEQGGITGRVAQACYGTWFYIIKTVIPRDITAFYPLPRRVDWTAPAFLAGIVATAGVSVVLFLLRRRWPGLLAAWLSYLVLLAPNSGLLRIGDQMAADRYSYLSMMGLVVAVGFGLGLVAASSRPARAVALIAAGAAVLGLVALTRDLCRIWSSTEALWTHALVHAGDSHTAHLNLGVALSLRGEADEAKRHYAEALRLDPRDAKAHLNLGVIFSRQGAIAAAESHYAEALRLDPRSIESQVNLGAILAGRGDVAGALGHYAEALRLDPDHAEANNNLAMILAACPDPKYRDGPRAVAIATRACERSAWQEPGTLDTLAAAYAEAGDFAAAVRWQTQAIALLGDESARDRYRSRLELYRARKPYREAASQRPRTGEGRSSA
jgi:Flp pilus assembly protein TadD